MDHRRWTPRLIAGAGLFLGDFPLADVAAPAACLALPLLDELLEAVEVVADPHTVEAQRAAERFLHPLGVVGHLDVDPGLLRFEGLERNLARVVLAMNGSPRHDPVGLLLADLRLLRVLLSADLGLPLQVR